MSNTFSPNGFQPVRRRDGTGWNASLEQALIAAANTHTFFRGDPVCVLSTGYIDALAVGSLPTQGVLGIFWGCEYQGTAVGTSLSPWNKYYAGAAQSADTKAQIIIDPMVVFRAWVGAGASSAAGGPATQADIYANIDYILGTGNTASGMSGAYANYTNLGITATLPFSIIGLVQNPPGVNGTDITSAGNMIEVVMNQSAMKVGTTGV